LNYAQIKRLNNKCHTLARDKCYDDVPDDRYKEDFKILTRTKDAHKFYNAPKCVYDTLSASKLQISMYSIFILLGILFVL
jgi:hypothetical protein